MKPQFVADLQDGQAFSSTFLVREKEIRKSPRTGKSWLELSLTDRTGSISGKMWDNFEDIAKAFECDDVVQVRAALAEHALGALDGIAILHQDAHFLHLRQLADDLRCV